LLCSMIVVALFKVLHVYFLHIIVMTLGGLCEILRLWLSVSLVFLVYRHSQKQRVTAKMVFAFRHAWKPLAWVAIILCLINQTVFFVADFLLHHNLQQVGLFGFGLPLVGMVLVVFSLTYFNLLGKLSMLLILDKKMTARKSINTAFRSVNQHWVKNISLILLAQLVFTVVVIGSLGISIIWFLPWLTLVTALQYQIMFNQRHTSIID